MITDDECNRLIAEYMGDIEYGQLGDVAVPLYLKYTISLDTLVPVWFKYCDDKFGSVTDNKFMAVQFAKDIMMKAHGYMYSYGYKLQQAAAHTTAKAIQEIEG